MKMQKEGLLHAQRKSYPADGESPWNFEMYACDMSEYGYINLGTVVLEAEVPDDAALTAMYIEVLKKKQMKIQAEAYIQSQRVQEEINSLLAIENKAEATE